MTGKGVRWGRDSVGRSAPAFMAASTTASPPQPNCTAKGEADVICSGCFCRQAGQLWTVCFFKACAGRRIRWMCLPAVPVQQALCVPVFIFCLPCPLPSSVLAPVQCSSSCFAPFSLLCACHLFISMCARIVVSFVVQILASCKTAP